MYNAEVPMPIIDPKTMIEVNEVLKAYTAVPKVFGAKAFSAEKRLIRYVRKGLFRAKNPADAGLLQKIIDRQADGGDQMQFLRMMRQGAYIANALPGAPTKLDRSHAEVTIEITHAG